MVEGQTTGRKVAGGFAAALVVVFVIGIVSFGETVRFRGNSDMVSHTYKVLDRLAAISTAVHAAESYQRGYLLTGNPTFLAERKAVGAQARVDLAMLRELVSDNAAQERRVGVLESLIGQRAAYLDATIVAHDRGDVVAADKRVDGAESDRLTLAVRLQVERMSGVELSLLEQRNRQLDASLLRGRIVTALGSLLAVLVTAFAGIMIYADLNERARAEAAMLEARDAAETANHAKSDFLARMSHELRTPLNSVIGFANVLLKNKGGTLGEQDVSYLKRIQANGKHLLGLINDILDLSKIEAGRVELFRQSVDLAQLISETVSELAPSTDDKDLRLLTKIPPNLERVVTDSARLKQVLINLIANAIKFTETGTVTVSVVADARRSPACVEITDTGKGIREDRREAIFGAFEQEDNTTTRRHDGTGLGLAISRALCQRLGYRLELDTELGRGSTFRIVLTNGAMSTDVSEHGNLPHQAQRAATRIGSAGDIGRFHIETLRNRTVLVIDDERDARVLLREMLEEFNVRVLEAGTGEEGIRLACEHEPDLITLDLKMPDVDGWEVVRRLQADPDACDIPIVIVSIVGGASQRTMSGALDFLDKPASREEIIEVIARRINHRKSYVLVVDDDADARELFRLMAESHGAKVRTADSGRAALGELDRRTPSLMILDIGMDHIDGLELLSVMRSDARFEALPVVVVTGKDLTESEQDVLRGRVISVLRKNGDMDQSLQRILQSSLHP